MTLSIQQLLSILLSCFICVAFITFAVISIKERENRALKRSIILAAILPVPYILFLFIQLPFEYYYLFILNAITIITLILLIAPIRYKSPLITDTPPGKIDERDIMFSRRLLKKGDGRYEEYYGNNPDKLEVDDNFRTKPGLLNENATLYHPFLFNSSGATFNTVEQLHSFVDGEIAEARIDVQPENITNYIKQWCIKIGAVSVGITELKDYHLYSYGGRLNNYGEKVELNHKYAIAMTLEMDKFMMDPAPKGSVVMESAQQYLNSGVMAVQVAEFIRSLGYPAKAHIDGRYQVVCPLIARDAGLGEIGRMGLLMTPELGPRVRIAVVTTDVPLLTDSRNRDESVLYFCAHCKKCADTCPSRAISFDDRQEIDGVSRWQISQEKCYTYWCEAGTDCGRCIKVCPYSHPDNFAHNLVRKSIRNSRLFAQLAVKLDDFFYGKKPPPGELEKWMA